MLFPGSTAGFNGEVAVIGSLIIDKGSELLFRRSHETAAGLQLLIGYGSVPFTLIKCLALQCLYS